MLENFLPILPRLLICCAQLNHTHSIIWKFIKPSRYNAQTTCYVYCATHGYIKCRFLVDMLQQLSHSFFWISKFLSTWPLLPLLNLHSLHLHLISAVCAWLLELELYLGDQSIRGQVAWAQDGRSHKLVLKSNIHSVEELTAANESDFNESPNPTLLPIPATLLVVVLLSNANFWMVADTSYCGPGKFNQSLNLLVQEASPTLNPLRWTLLK